MIKRYRSSIFVKGFMSLFAGSAIAQLIPLALSPFISRYFSVDDLAVYGLFFSIVSTFSVIVSGRYEMAVVLPKEESDSIRLVHLSVVVALLVSLLFGCLIWLWGDLFSLWLNNENIRPWLWLLPISLLLVGAYQAFNFWLIRKKGFFASAINKVGQRVFEGSGILGTGLKNIGPGLIVSDVVGRMAMLLFAIYQSFSRGFGMTGIDGRRMLVLAREYRDYPMNFGLSSLANSAAAHVPILFISNAYLAGHVGLFNMMKYVLSAPVAFISRNIAQVFLERLSEKWRNNQAVLSDFKRLTLVMTAIAMVFTIPVILFGEELFAFVFGDDWSEAGVYAQVMIVSFALRFIVSPLSSLLNAVNQVRVASYWQWGYFVMILSLVPASGMGWSMFTFLIYYCAVESLAYLIYWVIIYVKAKRHDDQLGV